LDTGCDEVILSDNESKFEEECSKRLLPQCEFMTRSSVKRNTTEFWCCPFPFTRHKIEIFTTEAIQLLAQTNKYCAQKVTKMMGTHHCMM